MKMRGWILMIRSILEQTVDFKGGKRSISYRQKIRLVEKELRKDENIGYVVSFKSDVEDDAHVFAVEYTKGTKDEVLKKWSKEFEILTRSYLPERLAHVLILSVKNILIFIPKMRIL